MEKTKEEYLALLQQIAAETGRLPKKSDVSPEDVNRIKGMFGPWPWALEAAGLKPSKQEQRHEKNMEKRQRARQRRKDFRMQQSETEKERK